MIEIENNYLNFGSYAVHQLLQFWLSSVDSFSRSHFYLNAQSFASHPHSHLERYRQSISASGCLKLLATCMPSTSRPKECSQVNSALLYGKTERHPLGTGTVSRIGFESPGDLG